MPLYFHTVRHHISTPRHNPITIQTLLSHYTFRLQQGVSLYIVCIPHNLHIPPSYSLLLSPLQVLTCCHGQRTTSHITPHHCYHYTFVLQWGFIVYVCIPYHLHIPPSHSRILSRHQILTCGYGPRTGHGHDNDIPRMTPVSRLHHVAVQQVRDMTYLCKECHHMAYIR